MERPDLWSLYPWTLEERGFYALAALGTLLLADIPFSLLPRRVPSRMHPAGSIESVPARRRAALKEDAIASAAVLARPVPRKPPRRAWTSAPHAEVPAYNEEKC